MDATQHHHDPKFLATPSACIPIYITVDGHAYDLRSDTVDLTPPVSGVVVGGQGDIHFLDWAGNENIYPEAAPGVPIWLPAKRIYATGTTATRIMGYR